MNMNKNYLIIVALIFSLIFRFSIVYATTYSYNWSNYVHATTPGDFYSFNPDGSKYIASSTDGSAYWTSITVSGYLAPGASFQLVLSDGSGDTLGDTYSSVPQTISLPNGPYYTGVRLLLHNSNGESEIYISSGVASNGNSAVYTQPSDYNPPSGGGGGGSSGGGVATLSAPNNVVASNVTCSSATISWDPVSGATGYKVYQNGSLLADVGNTTSYNLTGLQAGNQYSIQVSAYDSNGESPLSGAVTIVTKTANPIVINPPPININIPTPLPIEFPPAPPAVTPPAAAQAPSIAPVNIPNEQQFSTTMPQYVPQHYDPNSDPNPYEHYVPPALNVPDAISSPGPLPSNPDPTIMPHDPAQAIDPPNTKDTPQQMDPVNIDTPKSPDPVNMDQPKMPDPVNMDTPKSPDPAGNMDAPLQRDPPLTPDPPLK